MHTFTLLNDPNYPLYNPQKFSLPPRDPIYPYVGRLHHHDEMTQMTLQMTLLLLL